MRRLIARYNLGSLHISIQGVFMSESTDVKLRFHLQNVDPSRNEEAVRRSFDEALQAAIEEAGDQSEIKPKAEFEGGFFGAGETVVVLWILHALKVGGIAFGTGAMTAAGKSFYEKFLEPQLQKRNLLPSKLEEVAPKPESETPEKK
jgi:hypothetical protein